MQGNTTVSRWRLFGLAWGLIAIGTLIAHLTQTSGGITIKDVRFSGDDGSTLSALLYLPSNATPQTKAPGILAVHGYINSREVQSGFAIEFARRGYVVLALDQTGHGYSDPPAFGNGFGGPAALAYLRALEVVDIANIGLEGHSMGGWAVLAAASAQPDGYASMVLEGSSTGAPFAADGTATWPRNLAVVFSKYDEFAELMWGVARAQDVSRSPKLQGVFATTTEVRANEIYGNLAEGTARILHQPPVTHPGDHLSREAIGHSLDWFERTLSGGTPIPSSDQIWWRKELGTLIALVGFVVLLLAGFQLLLGNTFSRERQAAPATYAFKRRDSTWWLLAVITSTLPVATFYLFFGWAEALLPPSAWLPQGITNQVLFWAIANGLIAAFIGAALAPTPESSAGSSAKSSAKSSATAQKNSFLHWVVLALATTGIAYLAVVLADQLVNVDFRFWFVGVKAMSGLQLKMAAVYLLPFTLYFIFLLRGLHLTLSVAGDTPLKVYVSNALVLTGGFIVFLVAQYASLFIAGSLLTPDEPLNTIVMIQFVPLLLIVATVSTFTYRRTNSVVPGGLITGAFVTWYIVAGQATQFAVG